VAGAMAAVFLALVLVAASVHADATAAPPARRLLGAGGGAAPPPPPPPPKLSAVFVTMATTIPHCGITHDPNTPCPPPSTRTP
jgi:hypothetical protein